MTVTVQLFAAARDSAGSASLAVHLDDCATVAELRKELAQTLGDLLPKCAIAVNHDFATDDMRLKATDEVAVIPPVSGG